MPIICGIAISSLPFAFTDTVNAAIIAGVFSIINTMLNLRILRSARETRDDVRSVKRTARESITEIHEHLDHAKEKDTKNGE